MFTRFRIILALSASLLATLTLVLFFVLFPKSPLEIKNVYPTQNQKDVSLYPNVRIEFSRPLYTKEQGDITFSSTPNSTYSTYWSNDESILYLFPKQGLSAGQKITIKIDYDKKTFSWTFVTAGTNTASQQDLIKKQGEDDSLFANSEQQFLTTHPWYAIIPPANADFFIGYDKKTDSFFVDLYPPSGSPDIIDQQVAMLKKTVLDELMSIGVPANKHKIEWGIYPK